MLERCIGSGAGLKGTFGLCINAFFDESRQLLYLT